SSSGKDRPQSTTTILSSYSKAVMFMPICSRPPSGIIFKLLSLLPFKWHLHIIFRTQIHRLLHTKTNGCPHLPTSARTRVKQPPAPLHPRPSRNPPDCRRPQTYP